MVKLARRLWRGIWLTVGGPLIVASRRLPTRGTPTTIVILVLSIGVVLNLSMGGGFGSAQHKWVDEWASERANAALAHSTNPRSIATQSLTAQAPQPLKAPKVVFFGSSSTVGFGTTRGDRRWTTLLSRYLGWEEINEGLSGSTVSTALRKIPELMDVESGVERWRKHVLSRKPDRVVILYGVNDAFRRIKIGTPQQPGTYSGDLTKMLVDMSKELKPRQLIISSSQPNPATQDRRQEYDRILATTAKQIGSYYIDAGKEAFPQSDLADYSTDGLHMNNLGHAIFASYMANKMVDLGIEPAPRQSQGGNNSQKPLQPLPGGYLYIDLHQPLTFGRIKSIETKWVAPGRARIAIVRPDGRGGYEAIYRTNILNITPGTKTIEVPNWWVLDSDRLAVWTEGNCLGGYALPERSFGHLAVPQGHIVRDIPPNRGQVAPQAISAWVKE